MVDMPVASAPSSFITLCSIGSPWQSQPGTKRTSWPALRRLRTTMSLRILLSRWPMWMVPLADGGPS